MKKISYWRVPNGKCYVHIAVDKSFDLIHEVVDEKPYHLIWDPHPYATAEEI